MTVRTFPFHSFSLGRRADERSRPPPSSYALLPPHLDLTTPCALSPLALATSTTLLLLITALPPFSRTRRRSPLPSSPLLLLLIRTMPSRLSSPRSSSTRSRTWAARGQSSSSSRASTPSRSPSATCAPRRSTPTAPLLPTTSARWTSSCARPSACRTTARRRAPSSAASASPSKTATTPSAPCASSQARCSSTRLSGPSRGNCSVRRAGLSFLSLPPSLALLLGAPSSPASSRAQR